MSLFSRFFSKPEAKQRPLPTDLPRGSVLSPAEAAVPHNFVWLNKQGVRSSRGFEVQFTGRFEAVYREGKATVTLYVESSGTGSISIERDAFERWENSSYRNSAERQAEMLSNFRAALEFQGLSLDV